VRRLTGATVPRADARDVIHLLALLEEPIDWQSDNLALFSNYPELYPFIKRHYELPANADERTNFIELVADSNIEKALDLLLYLNVDLTEGEFISEDDRDLDGQNDTLPYYARLIATALRQGYIDNLEQLYENYVYIDTFVRELGGNKRLTPPVIDWLRRHPYLAWINILHGNNADPSCYVLAYYQHPEVYHRVWSLNPDEMIPIIDALYKTHNVLPTLITAIHNGGPLVLSYLLDLDRYVLADVDQALADLRERPADNLDVVHMLEQYREILIDAE
jgi:hypothetical protein